jgi:hypothetical protein
VSVAIKTTSRKHGFFVSIPFRQNDIQTAAAARLAEIFKYRLYIKNPFTYFCLEMIQRNRKTGPRSGPVIYIFKYGKVNL